MNLFNFNIIQNKSNIKSGKIYDECPSNIALIKYWGKYKNQIPANSSLSFTLKNSFTKTNLSFEKSDIFSVKVILNGLENTKFSQKIEHYFKSIQKYLPFILDFSYEIKTENTFPHSSGIASSASGFGAIAKCLIEMRSFLFPDLNFENKTQEMSFLARLGSGSASRSIYKGLVVWGENPSIEGSSDEFAISYPYKIHENFKNFKDCILLIHEGEKTVSSTVGHELMNNHFYSKNRFSEANENLQKMISILETGNYKEFIQLVEHEALTLHAMMMMSNPAFILMKPNTLACIEKIWNFRNHTDSNLCFTLDAGANIHLLYPEKESNLVESFIKNDLIKYTQNGKIIEDFIDF